MWISIREELREIFWLLSVIAGLSVAAVTAATALAQALALQ